MTISRRNFIQRSLLSLGAFSTYQAFSTPLFAGLETPFHFDISLAQWSLHKAMFAKEMTTLDFPAMAMNKFGIHIVEYVSQFFPDKALDTSFLNDLKQRCKDNGVQSHLIMIDNEGSLGATDMKERQKAITNHFKWIDAAHDLNCTSIRVNLHGTGTIEEWKKASIESLIKLSEYGSKAKINVIVENHGGHSSNARAVAEIIRDTKMKNCGTLPDFGNFCLRREKGDLYESPCVEFYDQYKGVKELLPYAKGVSAKSFNFDEQGNEPKIDYRKMLQLMKESGFKGIVGIEYEGETIPEDVGILKTKALLEKIRNEIRNE